jgi:hypothetical protein
LKDVIIGTVTVVSSYRMGSNVMEAKQLDAAYEN